MSGAGPEVPILLFYYPYPFTTVAYSYRFYCFMVTSFPLYPFLFIIYSLLYVPTTLSRYYRTRLRVSLVYTFTFISLLISLCVVIFIYYRSVVLWNTAVTIAHD
jgi:hypothetical protein